MSPNLAAIVLNRELSSKRNYRPTFETLLESSYFASPDQKHLAEDFPLNDTVLSTIAVAISPDGETVATSHGDHTIKIFKYYTGQQIRIFKGHPRTPWTVKYHSKDSNIVASGCLGYEVRVWDIARGVCANVIRFEYSIISIAFHPAGQFIVIGSGPQLYTWDWKEEMPVVHGGGYRQGIRRLIVHSRNIRAVIFHPTGEHLFVAAPDPPRLPQATFTPCRLYAFKFSDITTITDGNTQPIELWTLPALVPQIHLYSDGGLDISQCGNFILTCAILYVNPLTKSAGNKGIQMGSFSPISHRERSEADDLAGPIPLSMWGQPGAQSSLYGQNRSQPSRFFSQDSSATAAAMSSDDNVNSSNSSSDQRFSSALSSAMGNAERTGSINRNASEDFPGSLPLPNGFTLSSSSSSSLALHMRGNAGINDTVISGTNTGFTRNTAAYRNFENMTVFNRVARVAGTGREGEGAVGASSSAGTGIGLRRSDGVMDFGSDIASNSLNAASINTTNTFQPVRSNGNENMDNEQGFITSRYTVNGLGSVDQAEANEREEEKEGVTRGTGGLNCMPFLSLCRAPSSSDLQSNLLISTEESDAGQFLTPSRPVRNTSVHDLAHEAAMYQQSLQATATYAQSSHRAASGGLSLSPPRSLLLLPPPPLALNSPPRNRMNRRVSPIPNRDTANSTTPSNTFGDSYSTGNQLSWGNERERGSEERERERERVFFPAPSTDPARANRPPSTLALNDGVNLESKTLSRSGANLQFAASNESQPIFVDPRRGDIVPEGWKAEESLCVFRLSFLEGELQRPVLFRHKALTGPLLKAVTSAKLSPKGMYALVGYGVRNAGVVEDHPYSQVASEVLRVADDDLPAISFLLDAEDEVNIAQFHPIPGNGIVYGTKRGKVKVFYRNKYEPKIPDENEIVMSDN